MSRPVCWVRLCDESACVMSQRLWQVSLCDESACAMSQPTFPRASACDNSFFGLRWSCHLWAYVKLSPLGWGQAVTFGLRCSCHLCFEVQLSPLGWFEAVTFGLRWSCHLWADVKRAPLGWGEAVCHLWAEVQLSPWWYTIIWWTPRSRRLLTTSLLCSESCMRL